jgi:hypothetical protein
MMNHLNILVMAAALSLGMTPPSHALDSPPPVPSQPASPEHIIKGDVQLIEGEFYFVKDLSGHEVRLHVNGGTKFEDRIKVGDKIEARVTSEGHAKSILLQIPQNGTAPPLSNTGPTSLQRVPEGRASR